jgi:hypothetical protein
MNTVPLPSPLSPEGLELRLIMAQIASAIATRERALRMFRMAASYIIGGRLEYQFAWRHVAHNVTKCRSARTLSGFGCIRRLPRVALPLVAQPWAERRNAVGV